MVGSWSCFQNLHSCSNWLLWMNNGYPWCICNTSSEINITMHKTHQLLKHVSSGLSFKRVSSVLLCVSISPICHHEFNFQAPLSFPVPHFSTLPHFFWLWPKSLLLFSGCRGRLIVSHFTECSLPGHKILAIYLLSQPQQLRCVCCFINTRLLGLHSTAINISSLFLFSALYLFYYWAANQWVSEDI